MRPPAVSRAEDALAEGKVALPEEAIGWGQPPVPESLGGASTHPSTNQLYCKLVLTDDSMITSQSLRYKSVVELQW